MTKLSWKTIVGLILWGAGIVVGYLANTPVAGTAAVALIIAGVVTSIFDILMQDEVKGWKCWVFVVLMTLGVTALTVAGISGFGTGFVIGGVVIILDIIFGVIVVKTGKKS